MKYIDKYPGCINCPVYEYCGTMVSTTRLCNSYNDSIAEKEKAHVLTLSRAASDEEELIEERLEMWDNITD